MCYMEDVYHAECGHWAKRPRIYHRCAGAPDQPADQLHTVPSLPQFEAKVGIYREHGDPKKPKPGMRMSTPCTNAVTCGSARELSKCGKCRIDVEKIVSNQTGMWFSCSRDPVTGKMVFKDRQPESVASKRARLGVEAAEQGPKNRNKPVPLQRTWEEEPKDSDSDAQSRSGSWSSHGHVEL